MADYFGNRYWTARYFPAGYWGVDETPAPTAVGFTSLHWWMGGVSSAAPTPTVGYKSLHYWMGGVASGDPAPTVGYTSLHWWMGGATSGPPSATVGYKSLFWWMGGTGTPVVVPPIFDDTDYHDGKPRVNPQDIIRERYLQQKRDLAEIIEKRFNGDDVSPAESPLPAELTQYLSPDGAKYMARREAERLIREDDEFAIVLALMN